MPYIVSIMMVLSILGALSTTNINQAQARALSEQELEDRRTRNLERIKARKLRQQQKETSSPTGSITTNVTPKETIKLALIYRKKDIPPALSNLNPILQDEALYGARIGVEDNNTTGAFTGQIFSLNEILLESDQDIADAIETLEQDNITYVIAALDSKDLKILAEKSPSRLIFNVQERDDALRYDQCQSSLFHIIPSNAMRSDALAQFLVAKNWKDWLLVRGQSEKDQMFAASLHRSAKKFGGKIVDERVWTFTHDARRTAKAEVPLLTKAKDYDVVLTSDIMGEFGEYVPWHTWLPRPVAGSQGLVPVAWHPTHEQWGAAQMQNRFRVMAKRWMTEVDYAAWTAVRSIGEAALRLESASDERTMHAYLVSPDFEIAAYKGVKVNFRPWNQQLRQRILLAAPRTLVSFSPQPEFIHPTSSLDTIGFDKGLSRCTLNAQPVEKD